MKNQQLDTDVIKNLATLDKPQQLDTDVVNAIRQYNKEWGPEQGKEVLRRQASRDLRESWLPADLKAASVGASTNIFALIKRAIGQDNEADGLIRLGNAYREAAAERDELSALPSTVKRGMRGVIETVPSMIASGAVAGPYGPIALAAAQEGNQAITEGRDAGLSGSKLATYTASKATIEAAPAIIMQRLGLGGLEKVVGKGSSQAVGKGLRAGLKQAGIATLQEIPEEIVTEIGHSVADAVSDVDSEALTPGRLVHTVQDTVVQTLMTGGVVNTPSVIDSANNTAKQRKSKRNWESIEKAAEENRAPSRTEWKTWGFSPERGKTAKQRREGVKTAVETHRKVLETLSRKTDEAPKQQQEEVLANEVASEIAPPVSENVPEQLSTGEEQAAVVAPMKMPEQGTGEKISGREVVRELEKIWGVPIRSGRVRMRQAAGIFKVKPQVIRMNRGREGDPDTGVHECAHFLDATSDILRSAPREVKNEVRELDYDQEKKRDFEGFAEFVRAYTTEAQNAAEIAPKFHQYFEDYLKWHPEIEEKVFASKKAILRYRDAGSTGRVLGQISKTGKDENDSTPLKEKTASLKNFVYRKIKNASEAVGRFDKEAIERGYKKGEGNMPSELMKAYQGAAPHFAARAMEEGVFLITDNGKIPQQKIGPSIVEALSEIADDADYERFLGWTYARHAIESWDNGQNPGVSRRDAQVAVNELYDERYVRAADKLTEFNNAIVVMLADSGAISPDDAALILDKYKHYIPLQRARRSVFSGKRSGKFVDVGKAIKGRKGSGLQVIDPVESTLARAVDFYDRATKQRVVNRMVDVATKTKGMGAWMEFVPPELEATAFRFSEIKDQIRAELAKDPTIEKPDEILGKIDDMTALTLFRPDMLRTGGQPIFRVLVDGEPRLVQINEDLAEGLGELNPYVDLGITMQVVRAACSALKVGATRLNPSFILTNAIKDYQTFLLQGEKGLKGSFDPAAYATAYVASEVQRAAGNEGDPLVRLWQKAGGELSTYVGQDRKRLRSGIKRLRHGKQGKFETAINVAGASETASRLAEFSAILEREGWLDQVKAGETPPTEVIVRAINAAHDVTVDFRRMGTWMKKANIIFPFLNAQVEGLDKTIRTAKDHPARTLTRLALTQIPLTFAYWWLRHDDDDYKERPEWQDGYWILPDKDGKPTVRIPRPHEWGLINSGIERMLDAIWGKDPEALTRWFKQAASTSTPNPSPAGATPIAEAFFNYDTFRNRPIVSERLAGREKPDQFYKHTSVIAKEAAKFLHEKSGGKISLSPAKIDHIANGLSGGLYRRAGEPISKLSSGEKWSASDVPGMKGVTLRKEYTQTPDEFYAKKESLDRADKSEKLRNAEYKSTAERSCYQYVAALMTDMRNAADKLPESDRELVNNTITGLARAAMEKEPLDRYRSPFNNLDSLPGPIRKVVYKHIAQKAATACRKDPQDNSVKNAVQYLKKMGITTKIAMAAMNKRLSSQGVKSSSIQQKDRTLAIRLKIAN